jgi:hypothetical protein
MGRGETSAEFEARFRSEHDPITGNWWAYFGGNPGDPGIVTEAAREIGDREGLDAEELDDEAESFGWEFHNPGWREAVEQAAVRLKGLRKHPPLGIVEASDTRPGAGG